MITLYAPEKLNAELLLPSSKSISNRALVIEALAGGDLAPDNISDCDDTNAVRRALKDSAAAQQTTIDVGAAGTAMRFLTAYFAVTPGSRVLTGTGRMLQRPIGPLVEALRRLGADIEYVGREGFPPLKINGRRLEGGNVEVKGTVSSQFISALLMVAPNMEQGLKLHLTEGVVSKSYIDLTLWMMKDYGADADWTSADTITVNPVPYTPHHYYIESDWSAASYWYELATMYPAGEARLTLHGLMDGSKQGDSVGRYLFSMLGVKTTFDHASSDSPATVRLTRQSGAMRRLDYDFTNCPDLAQTLVATCCALRLPFHFTGLASLRIKETDRIEALKTELRKLGFLIHTTDGNDLAWDNGHCHASMEPIDTYDDHRMAMAFAPLCVKFPGLRINHPEVVSKSYPRYFDDLRQAGVEVK